MAALTLIARVSDGLILSEAMDNDASGELDVFRTQAKKIFKTLSPMSQKAMTIDTGNHYFAYLIAGDVCYLTLCERGYPKKLIFKFLEELQKEFEFQYAAEVPTAKRPYAFIKFDTVIQKTKKAYADSRTARNLQRVTEDLTDVQRIMNKNIADILGRGEKIDSVSKKSESLLQSSGKYKEYTRQLNSKMFWRKYGWLIVAAVIVLLFLYFRFLW